MGSDNQGRRHQRKQLSTRDVSCLSSLAYRPLLLCGAICGDPGSLLPTVRSGQLRGLAVTTLKRFPTAPELPTIAESGIPGFDVSSWYALFVPAKTPPEIIARLNATTVTALSEPAVRARFEPLGVVVESSTPEGLGALLQSEIDKWGPIIKAAGISASN